MAIGDLLKGKSDEEIYAGLDELLTQLMHVDSEDAIRQLENMAGFDMSTRSYKELLSLMLDEVSPQTKKENLSVMINYYLEMI